MSGTEIQQLDAALRSPEVMYDLHNVDASEKLAVTGVEAEIRQNEAEFRMPEGPEGLDEDVYDQRDLSCGPSKVSALISTTAKASKI